MSKVSNRNDYFLAESKVFCYFVVLFISGCLYVYTCAPGVLWQDSGLFQYRVWNHDIEGKLGLALAHPLYHIIGIGAKYIPWGDFAYRVNLISAVSGAFAVANLFLLLFLWLKRIFPAVIGAVTLALSHTMWQHACIAEVYTLYTALFLAELVVLLQYCRTKRIGYLYLLGLFNGLALANHMWAGIALLCYMVFSLGLLVKKQIRLSHLAVIILLWILGALPYEYLIVKELIQTGDIGATLSSAAFGNQWQGNVLNSHITMKMVKENILFWGMNFPTPNALLLVVGFFVLYQISPRRDFAHVLLALIVMFFIFAARYQVLDRYAFFLPFYCLASIMVGLGCSAIVVKGRKILAVLILLFSVFPVCVYAMLPKIAEKMNVPLGTRRNILYRDEYKYFLQPWQNGYNGPERYAREVFAELEKDAIIFSDSTPFYTLWYLQEVKGERPDVKLVSSYVYNDDAIFTEEKFGNVISERPVYVLTPKKGYCPQILLDQYAFERTGCVWRVTEKLKNGEV